jgi:hypothetical protein
VKMEPPYKLFTSEEQLSLFFAPFKPNREQG